MDGDPTITRQMALGAIAIAVAVAAPSGYAQGADVPLRVITTPNQSAMEPYFAQELAYFRAAGLDVDITSSANGAAVAAGVVSGSAEIGNSSVPSLAQAHAKGIPIVAIAPGALYSRRAPTAILFVPPQSSVTEARQLNGKVIAVNTLRGLPQFGTQQWLDIHGGQSNTVQFIEMSGPVIISALRDNKIDAGLVVEPFVSSARGVAKPLGAVFDAVASSFLINVHFSTIAWASSHDDVVKQFRSCIERSAVWANKNPDQGIRLTAKYTKLSAQTLSGMGRAVYAEKLTAAALQPVIDLTAKYGGIAHFSADDLIYHSRT